MAKKVICPDCGSDNIDISIEYIDMGSRTITKTKEKKPKLTAAGKVHNFWRFGMAMGTFGISNLFVKKAKPKARAVSRTTTKNRTKREKICVCQNCGNSWNI